jgi:mannose/fructose/N-acetylgalactosamine-specific phosphotransferase system component IIC
LNNAVKQPGRAARIGLWLLPAYGFLLGLSTLTHQPPVADFDAYARYVTTDVFLVSHLGASILGAALAVLGVPSRRESLNSPSGAYRHTTETMEVMRGV